MTHLTNDETTSALSIEALEGVTGGSLKDATVKGAVDAGLAGAVGGIIGFVIAGGVVTAPATAPAGAVAGFLGGSLGYLIDKALN